MVHAATFLVCLGAFAALALGTERQQDDLFGQPLPVRATWRWRLLGWGALALALAIIVQAQGWAMGLVSYSGHTSLAAGIVLCALIARSRTGGRGRR